MFGWIMIAISGYLLGSIPFGFLVGRSKGVDVRHYGSGATGGTNVLRTLGAVPAMLTGLGDLLKGTTAAYIGYQIGGSPGYALGGLMAVVGHSYPFWLKFKGGKSVATGAGALLLRHPYAFTAAVIAGLATVIPTRYVSLGSLVGGLVFGLTIVLSGAHWADKLLAFGAVLVVYVRHWENLKRLAAGTENRFGQRAQPRSEG